MIEQIKQSERFKALVDEINTPVDIDDINKLEDILNDPNTDPMERAEVKKLLSDPEVRKIKKEIAQANTILNQKINDMNAEDNNE